MEESTNRESAPPWRNGEEGDGEPADEDHVVLVLDDEASILKGLDRLLTSHGYRVRLFANPEDFFDAGMPLVPACLLLDNHLGNGMNGLQVHAELQRLGWDIPTVFLTAHWDVRMVVNVMRAGADGFLIKPYDAMELMATVAQALQRARAVVRKSVTDLKTSARAASLTPREREIVCLVVKGLFNKEIADHLGLALVTVKVHRGRAMRKLGAGNPAELAKISALAGLTR
jgi:FixJ family two-component response regulator